MSARARRGQKGQILVIFAGGLILLLVIAALVIDLGFTFAIRRAEQNAADPGAIAAARWIRADPAGPNRQMMTESGCFYARQNGFFPSATGDDADVNGNPIAPGCIPTNDPNGTTLKVNYPPSAAAGDYAGRDGFVEVVIARRYQTFLAGVVGIARIGVSSSAVAAFSAGDSNNNSLVALDPGDCQTAVIAGNSQPGAGLKVNVGGGVHVNSNCPYPPATTPYAGPCESSGSAALKVSGTNAGLSTPATISVVGECAMNGSGATIAAGTPSSYTVNQGAVRMGDPLGELVPPPIDYTQPGQTCGGTTQLDATTNNQGCGPGGLQWEGPQCPDPDSKITCVTLNPGVYYGGWKISNDSTRLLLNPGIYIFAGGGIQQSNGAIDAITDASANPGHVLLYSTDNPYPSYKASCMSAWTLSSTCQGPLQFTAKSKVSAYGIDAATCTAIPSTCPYIGLLMWQDGSGLAGSRPDASCPTWTQSVSDCPVTIGGSTQIDIAGTIYTPDQLVNVDGGALGFNDGTATVQVISWAWKFVGNSTINMPYDSNVLYHFDQKGLVH